MPVVFVVVDGQLVVPVDTVKAKSANRLQRLVNVEADPRVVLLVDHYDEDWSQLWWVRAHGEARSAEPTALHLAALRERFPRYRSAGAVTGSLVVTPTLLSGWTEA